MAPKKTKKAAKKPKAAETRPEAETTSTPPTEPGEPKVEVTAGEARRLFGALDKADASVTAATKLLEEANSEVSRALEAIHTKMGGGPFERRNGSRFIIAARNGTYFRRGDRSDVIRVD